MAATCNVCLNLDYRIRLGDRRWISSYNMNTMEEHKISFDESSLRSSGKAGCYICQIIWNGIKAIDRYFLSSLLIMDNAPDICGHLVLMDGVPLEIEFLGSRPDQYIRFQYYTTSGTNCSAWPLSRKGFTANYIPISISTESCVETIHRWLSSCSENHPTCEARRTKRGFFPSRVLDLESKYTHSNSIALVETHDKSSPVERYATLSHCWGLTHVITTTQENLIQHKRGISWKQLPKIFQDAITLLQALRIRYVWIDSLCIVQDNKSDWDKEAVLMADIYANGYLNIAATGAKDSTQGCFKDRRLHYPQKDMSMESFQILLDSRKASSVFIRPSLEPVHYRFTVRKSQNSAQSDAEATPVLSRAWIFQERILAPRTLHFHPSEMVMECKSGLVCECTGLDKIYPLLGPNASARHRDISLLKTGVLLNRWLEIVAEYTRLNITKTEDRPVAILGVARLFQNYLRTKYLAGLWETDIARGLLWDASGRAGRTVSRPQPPIAPSWSWISVIPTVETSTYYARPIAHEFRIHKKFQYLGTSMSGVTDNVQSALDMGWIKIHTSYVTATLAHRQPGNKGREKTCLFTGSYQFKMDLDVTYDVLSNIADLSTVCCLFIGCTLVGDPRIETPVRYICCLVCKQLQPPDYRLQRIGLANIPVSSSVALNIQQSSFLLV